MYEVKLEIFEGPLDLLLALVDKNHLDITNIALASICGEYRDYLLRLAELNLEIESSFLTVFASLLEIKSKALLPVPPKSEEEEEPEPEHELVIRLREYRLIKEAAAEMALLKEKSEMSFSRPEVEDSNEGELEFSTNLTKEDILDAYLSVMRRFEDSKEQPMLSVTRDEVSFPLVIRLINNKIKARAATYFYELFDSPPDRLQFIIIFLALLEMARRRKIQLRQDGDGITIINPRRKESRENLDMAS